MSRPSTIVVLAAGYGAGLVTGLSRFPNLAIVAVSGAVLAVLLRDEWWGMAWLAFGAGALAGGHTALVRSGACAAQLPLGDHQYRIRTVDPGEGSGRVRLIGRRCEGTVIARWGPGDRLPAGATLRVTARWTPIARWLGRPDGTLMVRSSEIIAEQPTRVERMRTAIASSNRKLFGERAPLADALVAGWRGELDPDLRRAFASAGLLHLLAISGFHLTCIAGWILLGLRLCQLPRHTAEIGASLAALGYVAFLGWPAAGTRAGVLMLLVALCRWRQRNVRTDALVGASVLMAMLCDPWTLVDVGAVMSVLGCIGFIAAVRWSDRRLGHSWWIRGFSGGVGALIVTAPFAAGIFGQVAPIGVLLSLAGTPLIALLLPTLFLALALYSWLPMMAHALAASGNALLALLQLLVRTGAGAPGAAEAGMSGWSAAIPWLLVVAAAGWTIHQRATLAEAVRRAAWCVVAGSWLLLIAPRDRMPTAGAHQLALLFLDVGQGDAALIRTPLGHWIGIDAGPVGEGHDAGRSVVTPLLARQGARRIDLFVLSHAHRDHVGGATSLLERWPVLMSVEPAEAFADTAYERWLSGLSVHHARWRGVRAGDHWIIDGVEFKVLHPPRPWPRQGEDLNEDSVVLQVGFGSFHALLMGDAGFVAESALAGRIEPVNVLKVGHHGSRTASSEAFLAAARPQVAVVSVGRNNYGHPAPETMVRLAAAGSAIWRTDEDGTVMVLTDGSTFTVKGNRGTATFGTTH